MRLSTKMISVGLFLMVAIDLLWQFTDNSSMWFFIAIEIPWYLGLWYFTVGAFRALKAQGY